ncbi:hypothetical protein N8T08_005155 [Aspergillus melleus]|uniref:Uncharacterized protein n=1 Tax=Aspergillus melleus TaxID=138277 RepID=A0ACC3BGI7_9EURO|nr:hypothetical protein N8T08_005155 [Aspergillus melleus]
MKTKRATLTTLSLLSGICHASWSPPPEYALYISDDGHFFQLSDGSPFFWQADTAWTLMARLNYTETETYLADRASKGFNVVEAIGPSFSGLDGANRQGDLAFINMDVHQPNKAYWNHVDSVVELAWKRHGIRIALFPAWGSYVHNSENIAGSLNTSNAGILGGFIGKRYPYLPKILFGDINPTWQNKTQVKEEYAAGGVPSEYETVDWLPVYDALAEGIIRGERAAVRNSTASAKYTPLISLHNQNQWFDGAPLALASSEAGHRDWLTFDVAQSGHSDYPPNPPIHWWNCRRGYETVELMYAVGETLPGKKRPALDNEPHYEGRYNNARDWLPSWNASDVRVGTWQTQVFSGAAGAVYGADMVWQMYNPSFYESNGGGPALPWYEAIKLPGSEQIQFTKKAILDRGNSSFFDRVPAPEIIVGNAGVNDKKIKALRDSKGSWIMVYTPTGKQFVIDTKDIKGCDVKARWYDPLTSDYTSIKYAQCESNSTIKEFAPPKTDDHDDWTLVLEKDN